MVWKKWIINFTIIDIQGVQYGCDNFQRATVCFTFGAKYQNVHILLPYKWGGKIPGTKNKARVDL